MAIELPAIPLVGVDTGGTFTDFFYPSAHGIRTLKLLSTPDDPGRAIRQGLAQLGLACEPCLLIHGTTVGTNAVLEGKGARVLYLTNHGFADVLSLGRQQRQQVYAMHPQARPIPVAQEDCIELQCRLDADGQWLEAPSAASLAQLRDTLKQRQPAALAINLIHGWCAPAAEASLAQNCPDECFVACSSQVLAAAGEYERGIATWLQASTGPVLKRYLNQLAQALPAAKINVMQSDGTSVAATQAAHRAVRLLLSGPAGGVQAAAYLGQRAGLAQLLSFDMGGTSTDVALVGQNALLSQSGQIGPWPVAVPMVDIHTIGAGGGSLAYVDAGGLLQVGPASAGSEPGPACYARGGEQATVTDAHVVLGRIPASARLGGYLPLDRTAAVAAVERLALALGLDLESTAAGILRLANEQMSRALHVVSADRGADPSRCVLLSFGGAGGLHACELAELMGIQRVLVAPHAGVLSALGMTVARPGRRQLRSVLKPLDQVDFAQLERDFQKLEADAEAELAEEGITSEKIRHQRQLAWRYQGQKMSLPLAWNPDWMSADWHQAFSALHQARCDYQLEQSLELAEIQLSSEVQQRLELVLAAPQRAASQTCAEDIQTPLWHNGQWGNCPCLDRLCLSVEKRLGPAVISGTESTIYLAPGWQAHEDDHGLLWLGRDGD